MTILHVCRFCWATWAFRLLRERYPHRGLNEKKLSQTEKNIDSENDPNWVRIKLEGTALEARCEHKTWKTWKMFGRNQNVQKLKNTTRRSMLFTVWEIAFLLTFFLDVLAKLLQWLVGLGSGESTFRRRNPVAPSLCCRHLLRLFATPRRPHDTMTPHDTTFWNVEIQEKWGKNMEKWKKPSKSVLILNFCHYVWMIPNVCHYVRLCRTLCHIDSHIADIVQTLKVLCCQNGL